MHQTQTFDTQFSRLTPKPKIGNKTRYFKIQYQTKPWEFPKPQRMFTYSVDSKPCVTHLICTHWIEEWALERCTAKTQGYNRTSWQHFTRRSTGIWTVMRQPLMSPFLAGEAPQQQCLYRVVSTKTPSPGPLTPPPFHISQMCSQLMKINKQIKESISWNPSKQYLSSISILNAVCSSGQNQL